MNRKKQKLTAGLKIKYKDDQILLSHLMRFILLALELADVDDKNEQERIQKNFIDSY